jgi:DeoR family transcriptional regulator, suf operon transcriptional repressor
MEASEAAETGFSTAKQSILSWLKRSPDSSLEAIADSLGVSKVAALRHLTALEAQGLVERGYRAGSVGRPRVHFRLSPKSARLFPEAYAQMSLSALEFIERKLGRPAVVDLLQQRTGEILDRNRPRMQGKPLPGRVEELVRTREEGGYMAEKGTQRKGSFEFLEHNCPILAVAGRYEEACGIERRLFESLLGAKVDVSHRVVAGDPVCRFLVRPRDGPKVV